MRFTTPVLTQAHQIPFSPGIQSDDAGSIIFSTPANPFAPGSDVNFKLQTFDGVRRRCLPKFYKALEPGTEDDRMKGALWTLNVPVFGMSFFEFTQTLFHPTQLQQNTPSLV